jgi:membrane protease YdiL (CAAX protease family)
VTSIPRPAVPPRPDGAVAEHVVGAFARPWPTATWSLPDTIAVSFMPFGIVLFLSIVVGPFLGWTGSGGGLLLTFLQQVAMLVPVVWWVKATDHGGWETLGLGRGRWDRADVFSGLGLGLLAMVSGSLVLYITYEIARAVLGRDPQVFGNGPELEGAWLYGFAILAICFAPICEEVLFRGFLFNGLRRSLSFRWAVVISAFAFALLHAEPIRLPSLFVVGIILASGVERRRILVVSVVAHATVNVAAILAEFAAR